MTNFYLHLGSSKENGNGYFPPKPSFISKGLGIEDLMEEKPRGNKVPTKKVNTKVPKQVLDAFFLYCVSNNQFQKQAFSEMLGYSLKKWELNTFTHNHDIHGVPVDNIKMLEANFEFNLDLFSQVRELKLCNRLTYFDIYSQVIICYMNDKVDTSIAKKLMS